MRRQMGLVVVMGALLVGCTRDEVTGTSTNVVPAATNTTTTSSSTTSTTMPPSTTSTATSTTSTTTTSTTTSTSTTSTSTTSTSTTAAPLPPPPPPVTPAPPSPEPQPPPSPARTGSIWDDRPPSDIAPPPIPDGWTTETIGTSVLGRDITALHRPVDAERIRVIVIGGVHGNEPVSPPIVRSLVDLPFPPDVEVWLVSEMNPDGVAAGTRANANRVDLNRNFGWGWLPYDGGPAPFSEPETTAAADLILRVQPHLVVWVHQPLSYVSSIGSTPDALEEAWSRGSGVPVRRDVSQHGGGESWTNFTAGFPSMLIEADSWDATPEMVAAHRNGFAQLLAVFG